MAPPKRIRSAASIASRASSIETSGGMSSQASYTSWIQRRLPGHWPAGSCRPRALPERRVRLGEAAVVLGDERLADVVVDGVPDLAVRVDLGARGACGLDRRTDERPVARRVVADVAVVERVVVQREVADADLLVAGRVGPDAQSWCLVVGGMPNACMYSTASRSDQLSPIAPAWSPVRLESGPPTMRLEIGVRVLVAEDADVQVAVDARRVERARDRLEEVLVGDRRDAVLERDLVGVVAALEARLAAGERAGLDVAELGIRSRARDTDPAGRCRSCSPARCSSAR